MCWKLMDQILKVGVERVNSKRRRGKQGWIKIIAWGFTNTLSNNKQLLPRPE